MLATFQIVAVVTHVQIALVSDACISVLCVCDLDTEAYH